MKKDIFQVILGSAVLCVVMNIVFFAIGKFDYTVVLGTLLGLFCAGLNFIFLAFSLTKSLEKGAKASGYMGVCYLIRLAFIGAVVVFAIKSPYTNYVAAVIPLVFPRIVITFLQGIMKYKNKSAEIGGKEVGGA